MKETQIVCPICGAKFAIPEHEHTAVGTVIGKDSGLGTIHPTVEGISGQVKPEPNKTDKRLAALAAAGIDITNIYAMHNASGQEMLARVEESGAVSIISDEDPKYREILRGATIPERRLFRRWVMSQMFHMLLEGDNLLTGFTSSVNALPYEYQWKMTGKELEVQAKLAKQDYQNYLWRNHWFNKETVERMAHDYIKRLQKKISVLLVKPKHCKGQEYIRLDGRDIFVNDIQDKVLNPISTLATRIKDASSPQELLAAYITFKNSRPAKLDHDTHKSSAWIDSYKGSGAFYTLQNMFLFHGCFTYDEDGNKVTNPNDCIDVLLKKNEQYKGEGWRMLAYLQKTIHDNGIVLKDKFKEWGN